VLHLHRVFIFVGAVASAVWFGDHWGPTGAIAAGILGAVLGVAFASGIDEPVSFFGAVPRWLFLITGVTVTGGGLGLAVDEIGHGQGAIVPASIVAGVIGLVLCPGIRLE